MFRSFGFCQSTPPGFKAPLLLAFFLTFAHIWACSAQSTILPTDTNRVSGTQKPSASKLELKALRVLPAAFYLDANVETSFRIETNPFQTVTKRKLLQSLVPLGTDVSDLDSTQFTSISKEINQASSFDNVVRVNPNVTTGWSPSDQTQYFVQYFLIRDTLLKNRILSSTTHSIGAGAQHSFTVGKTGSIQPQLIIRELFQSEQIPVLDYLPAVTISKSFKSGLSAYVNSTLQCRFKYFINHPMRELDPFYTVGASYQKGRWSFSASSTFNQNFRHQFRGNALLPVNNYSMISDFEIDRQLFTKVSGLQAFLRAEPVWNFASRGTNGLSGMDFRLYYGLRAAVGKQAISGTMERLRQQYQHASP